MTEYERSYHRAHYKVRQTRGKATTHICPCGNPGRDWALKHNGDLDQVRDYVAMCRSCHMIYDKTKSGENNHFAKISAKDVEEIRAIYATGKHLQREIAEKFGLTQGHVSYIINQKSWHG